MFHVFFRQFQFPGFFQKIVHNLRCKAVPVRSSGGLFIFIDSSGNFLKLFGELFLLNVQVQPNSYNCKFYISTFKICDRLCKNTTNLTVILVQVIYPFNSKFYTAYFFHSLIHCSSCCSSDQKTALQCPLRFQNNTEINPTAFRRIKLPASSSSSCCLLHGNNKRAVSSHSAHSQLPGLQIGRADCIKYFYLNLWILQKKSDSLC